MQARVPHGARRDGARVVPHLREPDPAALGVLLPQEIQPFFCNDHFTFLPMSCPTPVFHPGVVTYSAPDGACRTHRYIRYSPPARV